MINFIVIDTRNPVVPSNTLGIEVTTPSLAAQCDKGNIDPQHGQMRGPSGAVDIFLSPIADATAAIDAALEWPISLSVENIATERPDLDSIGAMAVIALRRDRVPLGSVAIERIRRIAAADNFGGGKWAPTPLPTPETPWPSGAACVADTSSLAHIASICSPMGDQVRLPIAERVAIVAMWILEGDASRNHRTDFDLALGATTHQYLQRGYWPVGPGEQSDANRMLDVLEAARADVDARRVDMARAIADGRITLRGICVNSPFADGGDREWSPKSDVEHPTIAIVRGSHAGALAIGYCVAPIVVATNPEHRWPGGDVTEKVTIAFYEPPSAGVMASLQTALNALECQRAAEHLGLAWTSAGGIGCPIEREAVALASHYAASAAWGCAGPTADLAPLRALVAEFPATEPGVDPLADDTRRILAILASGGGWGGNLRSGILGSPKDRKTVLLTEEIVACVRGAL